MIIERGLFGANPGYKDIARHLFTRIYSGKIVIIVDEDSQGYAPLKKQWYKLMRRVQRQRSETLDAKKIQEYTNILSRMATMKFSSAWPPTEDVADVYMLTLKQLKHWAPEPNCRTIYVSLPVEQEDLHVITTYMRPEAVIVMCVLSKYLEKALKPKPTTNRRFN